MRFIKPATIDDAALVSSSVPENDHAAWNAATSYIVGDRVIRTQTHRIYEALVAGVDSVPPETSAELPTPRWLDVGPTNRWAMFDRSVSSQTTASSPITVVLAPGRVRSLALLNVEGVSTITITMVADAVTVFEQTIYLGDGALLDGWYDYFYAPIEPRTDMTTHDLPPYGDGQITLLIEGPGTISVGVVVAGDLVEVGKTRPGARLGIIDYSRKEADQFGTIDVVERGFAKRIEVAIVVDGGRVDYVARQLASVRAIPVVWIPDGNSYQSLIAYGFYKDWTTTIPYPTYAETSMTIESLT